LRSIPAFIAAWSTTPLDSYSFISRWYCCSVIMDLRKRPSLPLSQTNERSKPPRQRRGVLIVVVGRSNRRRGGYFSGATNVERVRAGRRANPGYSRRSKRKRRTLQDRLTAEVAADQEAAHPDDGDGL